MRAQPPGPRPCVHGRSVALLGVCCCWRLRFRFIRLEHHWKGGGKQEPPQGSGCGLPHPCACWVPVSSWSQGLLTTLLFSCEVSTCPSRPPASFLPLSRWPARWPRFHTMQTPSTCPPRASQPPPGPLPQRLPARCPGLRLCRDSEFPALSPWAA